MKRTVKAMGYLLVAIFFSLALSGCTKKDTGENPRAGQLVVWSFEDPDAWVPIKEEFESENKDVTLVYERQTFDSSYENRVMNSLLSGEGPDVWSMPNDWVYRHKEKLAPRTTETAMNLDDFVPAVKQSVFFDDKIYALTPSAQPLIAFYNSAVFKQTMKRLEKEYENDADHKAKITRASKLLEEGMPQSWTDFAAAMQLITQKSGETISVAGTALGTDQLNYSEDLLYLLMLQNETQIVGDDLKLAMFNLPATTPKETTDTPGKRALEFYTSFADPKNPNYSWNNTLGDEVEAFAAGKVAVIFGYNELQNTLAQLYPNAKYQKGSVPQLSADPEKFVDYAKFNAFGVSNLSPNQAAGWTLIDGLARSYGSNITSAERLYTSKKANEYDISLENRNTSNPEKNSLAKAQTLIKGRYPVEFDEAINSAIFSVIHGIQAPQNALDLTASRITESFLRKERW